MEIHLQNTCKYEEIVRKEIKYIWQQTRIQVFFSGEGGSSGSNTSLASFLCEYMKFESSKARRGGGGVNRPLFLPIPPTLFWTEFAHGKFSQNFGCDSFHIIKCNQCPLNTKHVESEPTGDFISDIKLFKKVCLPGE